MPKSRGRKKTNKKPSKNQSRGRLHAVPDQESVMRQVFEQFGRTADEADPVEAELLVSMFCGHGWKAGEFGENDLEPLGAMLEEARRRPGTAGAVALARATVLIAPTPELTAQALDTVDDLVLQGAPEPAWSAMTDQLRAKGCWVLRDAYGDSATVLCVFERAGQTHGLSVLVDFNHLGGWAKDIFLAEDVEEVVTLMREMAADGGGTFDEIGQVEARRLLEDAFAATDQTWQPEVSEDFTALRALALARLRALPESPPAKPAEVGDAAREQVIREFVASPEAADLPSGDGLEYCARLIVDYGADYDGGKVLRVSPAKIEIFLLGWLPKKAVLEPEDRALMPRVMQAWIGWAGSRQGLSPAALDEVRQVARTCAEQFDGTYDEKVPVGRALLAGLPEADSIDDLQDAIERRMFAMPYFGTRIGDEDFPQLDPNDPDERAILIQGEHPEYHDALADPGFEGEIDGVNPRLHLVMHEIVANQLWDNDPPETWHTARRLRDLGHDRHDILHAIGEVVMRHVHASLMGQKDFDRERYRAELDQLGRERP
ncbi:DUF1841 family protein [Kribbella catacumbae]|uniref:DUF1841 family protein n=1 Tax=Kribbella catacumbae TaxID=460086 RepID=UPI0003631D88|nr:DUF1841 family protein [Kribbella catacumbae]